MEQPLTLLENLKFQEQADYEKGFSDYFEDKIKPELLPLEHLRLKEIERIKKAKPVATCIIIGATLAAILLELLFMWANLYTKKGFDMIAPLIFIVGIGYAIYLIKSPEIEYQNQVRNVLIPHLLNFYGNLSYSHEGSISREYFASSSIIGSFDDYTSRDYINGTYKNVQLKVETAMMTKGTGKSRKSIFHGKIVLLQMNKNFHGKTIVKKDGGALWNWLEKKTVKLETVRLEDPKFEKNFEVYSSDQVEARYLLTTAFMENLIELANVYGTESVQASFFDQYLLLTFTSTNTFSMDLFKPASVNKSIINTNDIHIFLKEINKVLKIIDILNLTSKTGM